MTISKYIDHTLLKPKSTQEQIDNLFIEAKAYYFASVCLKPTWVSCVAKILIDSAVGSENSIKAAGRACSFADAKTFLKEGVTRIGTTSRVAMVNGVMSDGRYK